MDIVRNGTLEKVITHVFHAMDEDIVKETQRLHREDGTTAVCAWIVNSTLIVANVGDSRAVLGSNLDCESTPEIVCALRRHKYQNL
jgi:serine/threonine protein phosphatase PrpC